MALGAPIRFHVIEQPKFHAIPRFMFDFDVARSCPNEIVWCSDLSGLMRHSFKGDRSNLVCNGLGFKVPFSQRPGDCRRPPAIEGRMPTKAGIRSCHPVTTGRGSDSGIPFDMVNRSVAWAEWTSRYQLASLQTSNFDLKLTGFDESELLKLLGPLSGKRMEILWSSALPVQSTVPAIFGFSVHTACVAATTHAADVADLLRDDRRVLMITDPLYGVDYQSRMGQCCFRRTESIDWSPE